MSSAPAPAPAPLRWGILGTGTIAEDFANAVALMPDVHVQAIGSRNIDSAQAFAKMFNIPTAHGSFEALVADPSIDVIYIATPDAMHAPHALLSLRAGKPCLVEKPFADSPEAAELVLAESAATGLFVMEALWTRFCPAICSALREIAAGKIGRVRMVQSDFGCPFPIPAGALNALGVYSIALSQMVFEADARRERGGGEQAESAVAPPSPSKLQALGTLRADTGIDSQISVQMQYGPDQLSTFTASLLVSGPCEATITGTEGRIKLPGPLWHSTGSYIVTNKDGRETTVRCDEEEQPLSAYPRPFRLLNSQRLVYEALEVNRCVRAKLRESPQWSHAHTCKVMQLMQQIREQIKQ